MFGKTASFLPNLGKNPAPAANRRFQFFANAWQKCLTFAKVWQIG